MLWNLAAKAGACLLTLCLAGTGWAGPLELVKEGKPAFVIYLDAKAPKSVKLAAEELQRVVAVATGAKLPIADAPASPMICLGDNEASRKAGFSSDAIPDEGFRIATQGGNLFILGKDWGDDDKKWIRCDSTGTLFGVYEFLERVLGVRWLSPGDEGEDIPAMPGGLVAPEMDVSGAPGARARNLSCRGKGADVWLRRMRMGASVWPAWGHNFSQNPPTPVLLEHPEYMPLQEDGTREKPVGNRAWGSYEHKFCLSNPGLIQAFGDSLNAQFDRDPKRFGLSMAPADGGKWCVCPECMKLTLNAPSKTWGDYAPYGVSRTPLVMNFYNGVARVTGSKYPERLVGGLAYHDYAYPPEDGMKGEPNVFIGIAINAGYGYKFYKPETAARVSKIIAGWAATVQHLGWTDYSTWMRNAFGAPLPPGLSILKTTFGSFGKSLTVINYQGQEAWGYGGAHNYVVARLMWKPDADVDALYREYMDRAYGPAAPAIAKLYGVVEERLKAYIIKKSYPDHEIWYDTAQEVYAPIYWRLEELCKEAAELAATPAQKRRVEMMGENLVVLNWNLRWAGLLKDGEKSRFYLADADYEKFLEDRQTSPAIVYPPSYEKWRWQTALWNPETRALNVGRLPPGVAAPKLDGALDDEAWKTAEAADQFRMNERRRQPARWQTLARLAYDAENLYVAFECQETEPGKVRRECKTPGSAAVLQDDMVALCFRGPGVEDVEIAANAAGVCRVRGKATAAGAAKVGEASWTVEMSIPFKSLNLKAAPSGATWKGNLVRLRVGPPIEASAWNRVEERLEDARAFGEWRFSE